MVEPKEADVDEEAGGGAPRIRKEVVEPGATEEAKRVPGTQGDTLKWCRTCPGWVDSAFGSARSSCGDRTAGPGSTESIVLYHVACATINADLVRSIDLSPGSYGADYGRGLGGLVRIELQDPGARAYTVVASD